MPSPTPSAQIQDLRLELEAIKGRLSSVEQELEKSNLMGLRERIAVLEQQVVKLDTHKSEGEKRSWQFVFIAAGAGCAVVGGVVVQLVSALLKK